MTIFGNELTVITRPKRVWSFLTRVFLYPKESILFALQSIFDWIRETMPFIFTALHSFHEAGMVESLSRSRPEM